MQFTEVLTALRNSHDRLAASLSPLNDEQVSAQSYDDDWSIAQVASHLGSGAEIFGAFVTAGLKQVPPPGSEGLQPVWDVWNAKSAPEQARDAITADAAFLGQVGAVAAGERDAWRLRVFGMDQTLTSLLQMRLCEHAVHTWDIAVALDPSATVASDAVASIFELLPGLTGFVGKGAEEPVSVHIVTTDPEREFLLELAPGHTRFTPASGPGEATATLRLPAEALVRLVYGRLDDAHLPATVQAEGVDLDTLRRAFPGF